MTVDALLYRAWQAKLQEIRATGYDPYNSVGDLKLGTGGISFTWRPA